ncbi:MAG: carbon-nitrogen hydrolase family protein [Anaerolineae bacterium]|nr:carbon-nitrogen hydrolase family protein [Anaerolineae bacterium]
MPRTIKIAAVQMDATPAPLSERLSRAADLIAEAASSGAQLVVLPELFNTGYEYHDRNYGLAERIDGETVAWMKLRAAQHGIHLAGSLLLLDEEDIYNSQLIVAPDGRLWRYDKNYPFLWERAYFREGRGITIADTDLGKLGMLICWDSAHPDMWQRYAGKVDAMVITSCPPKLSSADLVFPDGLRVNTRQLGGIWREFYTDEEYFPGPDMDEHAAWMGVPVVHTVGGGTFRSKLPQAALSVGSYTAARPDLWSRVAQASDVVVEADFDPQTKVIDANGQVVARVTDRGDGFTLAEVALADTLPKPPASQPPMRTAPLTYFLVDVFGASAVTLLYRQRIRRQWGEHMAPVDPRTKMWAVAVLGGIMVGWLLGRRGRR